MQNMIVEDAKTGRLKGDQLNKANAPKEKENYLKVTSIFLSVDGEVNPMGQGAWSTFVRLSGCTAGCKFCDTKYSWKDGEEVPVLSILAKIRDISKGVKKITITGGEPLEQRGTALTTLIQELLLDGYYITVETNGLHEVEEFLHIAAIVGRNRQLSMILDWKLPSSGAPEHKIKKATYVDLPHNCFVKFVISDAVDFEKAIEAASFIRKCSDARLYFSPCAGGIEPATLFEWMKDSVCPSWGIGYNLQLHKYTFSDDWRDEEQ